MNRLQCRFSEYQTKQRECTILGVHSLHFSIFLYEIHYSNVLYLILRTFFRQEPLTLSHIVTDGAFFERYGSIRKLFVGIIGKFTVLESHITVFIFEMDKRCFVIS